MSADNGSFTSTNSLPLNTSVNHLRQLWSDNLPDYLTKEYTSEQAISGEHIVKFGKASSPDGGNSKVVSIYYNCTDCHNLVREDPVLSIASPEDRLTFAVEHDLPFLQGTTLWGVVNRESWYNGDYSLKYGEYVEKARNNLQEAIQLCATQCAQGRPLEDWETDAVIAYLSTLQITLGDLNLSEEEYSVLEGNESSENKLELLKSKYLNYSPATFTDVPSSLKEGYEHTGDPGRGRQLYVASCQFCHRPNGPSELVLTDFRLSLKLLKRNLHRQNQYSLYYLLRVGTYSIPGHKPYMPHFTEERMSDQQVEDLRAYIEAAV
jgi:mono/diheme cytochrome c family protein